MTGTSENGKSSSGSEQIPWPKYIRWLTAFALLTLGGVAFLVSNTTPHLHACSTINSVAGMPNAIQGSAEQSTLKLPLYVCQPIQAWSLIPFAALALLLMLPDFSEIGFGGVSLKRIEQISKSIAQVSEEVQGIQATLVDATGVTKDIPGGMIHKGAIRNVELRVRTVQQMLLGALRPGVTPAEVLYNAGYSWGHSWSSDFAMIAKNIDLSQKQGIESLLAQWSYYDATAGMGSLSFQYEETSGLPRRAEIRNCFLGVDQDGVDLRQLYAGYIAGSLDGLLESLGIKFQASIFENSVDRDVYDLQHQPNH